MKNFNVKQSGSEVILEEKPDYSGYDDIVNQGIFEPLILTSIDPNIKVDHVIREDQLEKGWQYFSNGRWHNLRSQNDDQVERLKKHGGYSVRQVAKLKQPVHEMTGKITVSEINGLPAINGLYCSYASKEIRAEIESRFEVEKSFTLPEKYTYIITPLNHAKISRSRITEGNNQPVHETQESGHDLETCTENGKGDNPLENITDEELEQLAKLAHQQPKANFKVIKRDYDLAHIEYTNPHGITYHMSFRFRYATVNTNIRFSKTEKEEFKTYKLNIGEISLSSQLPVPYIAIYQYLQSRNYKLPKYY